MVGHRAAGARIEDMGVEAVADLEKDAVVAAGGHGPVAEGDHLVDVVQGRPARGAVDADAPGRAVPAQAAGIDLAADFHQKIGEAFIP